MERSKFNYKDMDDVAQLVRFTDIILSFRYDNGIRSYDVNTEGIILHH